jgi:histone H3/H4
MPDLGQSSSQRLASFWHNAFHKAAGKGYNSRSVALPLARIKRLMKVEEDVRMVASEVPILFSLVTELFVEELTLRSWFNTEEDGRRILQRADICSAIKTTQMYDFLVDVAILSESEQLMVSENDMPSQTIFVDQQYKTPGFIHY